MILARGCQNTGFEHEFQFFYVTNFRNRLTGGKTGA